MLLDVPYLVYDFDLVKYFNNLDLFNFSYLYTNLVFYDSAALGVQKKLY